jgi:hypothetical protein
VALLKLTNEDGPEIARQAVEMIRALYAVEKHAAALAPAKKLEARQAKSVPHHLRTRRSVFHDRPLVEVPPANSESETCIGNRNEISEPI